MKITLLLITLIASLVMNIIQAGKNVELERINAFNDKTIDDLEKISESARSAGVKPGSTFDGKYYIFNNMSIFPAETQVEKVKP